MGAQRKYKAASLRRQQRVMQEVAPLMVAGKSTREIARELGLSPAMAAKDCALVRDKWQADFEDARDQWAGRVLAGYDYALRECIAAWEQSKRGRVTTIRNPDGSTLTRHEPPDPRWLSGTVAVLKEVSTYLGLRQGVDAVSRVEIPESTQRALAPLSTADYLAMLSAGGPGLAGITSVPPIQQREHEPPPLDVEVLPSGGTVEVLGDSDPGAVRTVSR